MVFCTVSDKNYLLKGLAMVHSLRHNAKQAEMLYWLCLDDETYNAVIKMSAKYTITPIHIDSLIKQHPELAMDPNRKSQYGDAYANWCWMLAPFFTWWVMKGPSLPVFYIDADIYFFQSLNFFQEIIAPNNQIMVHSHRNCEIGEYNEKTNPVGYYNVGVVGFNGETGFSALTWWKDMLLSPQNQYAKQYGTCGDQKYLDLFPKIFGQTSVFVFDEELDIAHGAPWNAMKYQFITGYEGKTTHEVTYRGRHAALRFWHFSHFNCNFETGHWQSSVKNEWAPENHHPEVREIYQHYYNVLAIINKKTNTLPV